MPFTLPVSLLTWNQFFNIHGSMSATTAPTPIKKLCMAKPIPRWTSGTLSATKARKGSMEMLMEASRIHSNPAAIHNAPQLGITTSASELRIAPTRK